MSIALVLALVVMTWIGLIVMCVALCCAAARGDAWLTAEMRARRA
jgi:hypothetical protein